MENPGKNKHVEREVVMMLCLSVSSSCQKVKFLGRLNTFSKLGEALGMGYVSPIKGKYLLIELDYRSKLVELDVCS